MKVYKKESVQHINASLEECWAFFSNPNNLQVITPKTMGFEVTDYDDKFIYAGQIIQYKIAPFLGIPLNWMTEIAIVKENNYFVDEQRFGPYTLWHHKHFFEATANGTQMTDIVHYALPFGFIRRIMNSLVVKNELKTIFEYRHKKIEELFNTI
jgi:ligand-binding SRPBCC domain-containing protein